jgi:hypothetical protein
MRSIRLQIAAAMMLTAIAVGCTSLPQSIRHDPDVQTWVEKVKAAEDADRIGWFFRMRRIAGYNEAVLYGRIARVDAASIQSDIEMRSLTVDRVKWIRRHFFESSPIILNFDSGTFTNVPLPAIGEPWVMYATANAKGIWYIHGAKRVVMEK